MTSTLPLPSPVSHKDYAEETVKADGMDFELVQPRKMSLSASESLSLEDGVNESSSDAGLEGLTAMKSQSSSGSLGAGLKALPETDEWGFLKEKSPTPEIFTKRSAAGDHRVAEQKWVRCVLQEVSLRCG
jgi:hypothetical protein